MGLCSRAAGSGISAVRKLAAQRFDVIADVLVEVVERMARHAGLKIV
jgi:hypothetical protein